MATKKKTPSATQPSNAPFCRNCSVFYSINSPQCSCDACAPLRDKNLTGICVFCCFLYYLSNVRSPIVVGSEQTGDVGYICYYCQRKTNQLCDCCSQSFMCDACCEDTYNHRICCKKKKIEFCNAPLVFAFPQRGASTGPTLGWVKRDESEAILNKVYPISKLHPKGFSINSSRRFVATEIEIFSYEDASKINEILHKWHCSVVHDGSIVREAVARGLKITTDRSFEINTSPACGDMLYLQLQEICEALAVSKATVSTGCGIHTHVDCRDFGYQEIQKFIKVYHKIEAAMFAAVHWSRSENDFCKPCGEAYYQQLVRDLADQTTGGLKKALIQEVYGQDSLRVTTEGYGPNFWHRRSDHYGRNNNLGRNEKRYSAINLHSYFLRGTVENRIHHGSIDFSEIYGWAKFQVDLFDAIFAIKNWQLDKLLEISLYEVFKTKGDLGLESSPRKDLNKDSVALGITLLERLLPAESFSAFLRKLQFNYFNHSFGLPCQPTTGVDVVENIQEEQPQRVNFAVRFIND